jgi:fructosamine-3-kinase
MSLWDSVAEHISAKSGRPFSIQSRAEVGGGCINTAYVLSGDGERFFVKVNSAGKAEMFAAELAGLEELRRSNTVKVPEPLCSGTADGRAYLVMEYLPLGRGGSNRAIEEYGHRLAAMHAITSPRYGWHRDNTIGSTPQPNGECDDWQEFWIERRLGYQLELAGRRGHGPLSGLGDRLLERLPDLLAGHRPAASLLHGDLWSGNHAFMADGTAVIFDPAVYYGDRETDLAMTELFGRMPERFYRAYEEAQPLPPGYEVRKILYNLYHILNHLNLFGAGYLGQAEDMIETLL